MRTADPKTYHDILNAMIEDRFRKFNRGEARIDLTYQVHGSLPNQNLAPLPLTDVNLFTGVLNIQRGGTSADLGSEGPGVLQQATTGAAVTVGQVDFDFIDFTDSGSSVDGVLIFSSGSGLAAFAPLTLSNANLVTGVLAAANGGTGVNNSTRTLTISTNAGTIAFSAAASTFTIPATGTAALLGVANQAFTDTNSFAKILRAHTTSGTTGYGLRQWDGSSDFSTYQSLDLGGVTFTFFANNRYYDGTGWQQFNTRPGSSFQIGDDGFNFFSFPASSSTPTSRYGLTGAGVMSNTLGDAATNSASTQMTWQHNSSGTPAAGYGSTHLHQLQSSTTANRSAADQITTWATATDASRKARRVWNIYDTASREAFRIEASGTAAMIGFLGAAAVARQNITGVRTGTLAQLQTVMANLLTGLANLGLITDSTT